jgi:hypothetical protein
MKNKNLLFYRIATGLMTLLFGFSAIMYFAQHDMVAETFLALGFPTFIIYPLAIAKLLGLTAIWTNKFATVKEWAYAGFTFNALLAAGAHIAAGDGEFAGAIMGLVFVAASYFFNSKVAVANS